MFNKIIFNFLVILLIGIYVYGQNDENIEKVSLPENMQNRKDVIVRNGTVLKLFLTQRHQDFSQMSCVMCN